LRILHVCLSRGFAGTERATAEMCNAHVADHAVCLVVRRSHRSWNGVSIVDRLDPRVELVTVGDWWPGPGVRRAVEAFGPDIVHAHLRRSTRLLARRPPPCPTIVTLHMWVNGPQFLAMDGVIVIADWQKRGLAGYGGRIFEINESLLPHPRLPAAGVARLRAELGAAPGEFLIGGVGRLARSKGFDVLIRAFLRADPPGARLVIVGDGRERGRLERLGRGRVRFTGFRADAKDCYQAFDLFVSPSRSEPLGRVLFEALDAGTPVLATATQGPSEVLSRYPGRLVPIDDVDAMAAALSQLAAARPPRVRPDLREYHLDRVAAQTLAAYRELIDARRGVAVRPVAAAEPA
jgi:glycosyltransferase involved in cell wall biosynthesis